MMRVKLLLPHQTDIDQAESAFRMWLRQYAAANTPENETLRVYRVSRVSIDKHADGWYATFPEPELVRRQPPVETPRTGSESTGYG